MLNKIHSYVKTLPEITINIETRSGLKETKKILHILKNDLKNVTFGRFDLSRSFFDKRIHAYSLKLNQMILIATKICKAYKVTTTIGENISKNTWDFYNLNFQSVKNIK